MKRLVLNALLLFVICLGVDTIIGFAVNNRHHVSRVDNTIFEVNSDILCFGSSKVSHNYNSKVFEDSLGCTFSNCGQDGNGGFYYYPAIASILERYAPKLVIIDIMPEFDLVKYQNNERYMAIIRPYLNVHPAFGEVASTVDETINYKKICNAFVWNSAVTTLLKSQVVKKNEEGDGGFKPLHGQIEKKTEDALTDWEYDETKLQLLDKTLLMLSRKTRVMVCSSPCYYEEKTSIYKPVEELCNKYSIPYISFTNDEKYLGNATIYRDELHMNIEGATIYSNELVHFVREALN